MKIVLALATMLAINMFLFLGQVGVTDIASDFGIASGTTLYNYDGSLISDYDTGDYNLTTTTSLDFPDTTASIDTENNNFLIDAIATLKSWGKTAGKGFGYFSNIVNAVPNFLKAIGLPQPISFALGFFWNALSLFLVVMLIWGRQL